MEKGIIFDLMRFSTRDGPGIRTTVFLKGCPLSCWWCHNPESQKIKPELMLRPGLCISCQACVAACPQGAITWDGENILTDRTACKLCGACVEACYAEGREMVGKEMTVAQVLAEVMKDSPFYEESGGGVTFSGGEAFTQSSFLQALIEACKGRGLHVAVDTSGFVPWAILERTLPYVDLYLYDLKIIDEEAHRKYTGVSNALILSNLRQLSQVGARIVVRVPVIPGVNDSPESIRALKEVAASLPHLVGLELLPYHQAGVEKYRRLDRPYQLADTVAPSNEQMETIAQEMRSSGIPLQTGG